MSRLEGAETIEDLFPEADPPTRTGREPEPVDPSEDPKGSSDDPSEKDFASLADKKLTEIKDAVAQGPQVAQLLADPDIQKVLKARQRGEKVVLVEESEWEKRGKAPAKQEVTEPPPDLNEFNNTQLSQYLAKTIVGEIRKDVGEAIEKSTRENIAPLKEGLDEFKKDKADRQEEDVKTQLSDLKKRYDDVEQYAKPMVTIYEKNPGLSLEEIYFIAKRRTVGPPPEEEGPNPESERPATPAGPPPIKPEKRVPAGSSNFQQLLNMSDTARGRKLG